MTRRDGVTVDITTPDGRVATIDVVDAVVVGRDCDGHVVADEEVSRRHLRLARRGDALTVEDLGSTNGTSVNGTRISRETPLAAGDLVGFGRSTLTVRGQDARTPAPDREVGRPAASSPPTSSIDDLESRDIGAAIIRYRPGSHGARIVPAVAEAVRQARRRLARLGSESWGVKPSICLVDPFPDPTRPGEMVTDGTVIDTAAGEIWMVATAESPPERPERPLAIYFGSSLPAAQEITPLLVGYGLYVAESPVPDDELRAMELPPLGGSGDEDVDEAMALSFVRYLVEDRGRDEFLQLLATAQPGRVDAAAQEIYGLSLAALEEAWRERLVSGGGAVKPGQFVRLALRYMRPHARREAETFVYMLLGLVFTMVFPFAFRRLLDDAIPSGEFDRVVGILVVLSAAFAVSLLAGLRRAYLSAYVSGSIVRDVRNEMFGKLQSLSSGWFSRRQQGDVLSRLFSDVGELEQGLSATLREGLFQVLSLVVAAVVLVTLNPLLATVVLLGAPLVALVYRLMADGARKRSMAVQEQLGGVLTVAAENYDAQPVVKAFNLESRERGRFARASERLFQREVRMQLFGGLFGLSVNMIVTLLRMFVLGLGAWLILRGNLTIGGLVAFMSLMGEVLSPVTVLIGIGQQLQSATGALIRINEVLDAVPDIQDAPDAMELPRLRSEIRLDNVGFSYTPERRTLDGVSAVIEAGSRVAFVGPTGAGKSSVLQLLMRFYDADDGTVSYDGIDIRGVSVASLRQQLGVVFQETFLFDITVRENIALGKPGATDEEIEAAARAAEVHDFIVAMPRGYDTLVGERGGRLSGGQRQRIAIARALLRDPAVLLLDEATSALDPRTERLISDTLERVGRGRTTIAVTHRLTSITDYDRIFVIVEGRLVEQGTHDSLVARGGVFANLWAEQTGGTPQRAGFDAAAALGRVAIFSGLDEQGLLDIAAAMQAVELSPGEEMTEGGGRLALIRAGRAHVVRDGDVVTAELGPGDVFGMSALLGRESGAVLRAVERMTVLVLNDEKMAAIAARYASVRDALVGALPAPRPTAGVRLAPAGGRLTGAHAALPTLPPPPDGRRMTQSLSAIP